MAELTIINTGIKARYNGQSVEISTPLEASQMEMYLEILKRTTSVKVRQAILNVCREAKNSYGWIVFEGTNDAYAIDGNGYAEFRTSIDGYLARIGKYQERCGTCGEMKPAQDFTDGECDDCHFAYMDNETTVQGDETDEAWDIHTLVPEVDDEELSPEDIAALGQAMSEPTLGPYTTEEITAMVMEAQAVQDNLIKFFEAAYQYCHTIISDYLPQPHEYIYGSLYRPISPSWARIPEAHYVQVDWKTQYMYTWVVTPQPLDEKTIADYELKLVRLPEALQHAWDELQSTVAYTGRFQCYHNGLSAFAEAVAII